MSLISRRSESKKKAAKLSEKTHPRIAQDNREFLAAFFFARHRRFGTLTPAPTHKHGNTPMWGGRQSTTKVRSTNNYCGGGWSMTKWKLAKNNEKKPLNK